MNSNSLDLNSREPYNGPLGYAVKIHGEVSVRTASPTTTGAKINGLVLFFKSHPVLTSQATDEEIDFAWDRYVEASPEDFTIVPVVCTEIHQGEVA